MSEFIKRTITSILLIIFLYFCLINNIVLFFSLLFISFLIFDEFYNIFKKILKNNKSSIFIYLIFVLCYLIYFSLDIWSFLVINNNDNKNLLLFIVTICIATDIGGYIFGKIFKGKKLTSISPNKTYSGVLGSFLLSLTVSAMFFSDLNVKVNYLIIAFIISLISQIGDLFVSYLKRKANLKDTGNFLPGHGGILDRLDGILFATPAGIILVSF